jgi:hypothetical protein
MALWERIFPRLLEACDKDTETEVQAEHLGALAECILKLGAPAMNVDRMNAVGNLMATLFTKHFEKCDEARKLRADEPDHDEEADRALRDEVEAEAAVIGRISDVWHALFSKCGDAVVPYFEALLPAMLRMFEHDRTPTERQWILCIFDDLIEFATPHSLRYQVGLIVECVCIKTFVLRSISSARCYSRCRTKLARCARRRLMVLV